MSCFGKLRHILSFLIPLVISFMAEFYATIIRLRSLSEAEEIPISGGHIEMTTKDPTIILNKINVTLGKSEIFKNISMEIKKGLTVVIGHIGCGKTTFLKTILEDFKLDGNLTIYGKISYASQEPWLFPSTIKHNILFGEEFNAARYRNVLQICALDKDLSSFSDKDDTIVGDNGLNLSKGQQARINLARAVYRKADIYLLDDNLAALDGRVADHIFKECILTFLKDKLCLFVSNNEEHISKANRVIEIKDGHVKYTDSVENIKFEKINTEIKTSTNVKDEDNKESKIKKIYSEEKKSGGVDTNTYKKYITFGGGYIIFSLIMLLFVTVQTIMSYSDKLVSNWVTLEQNLSTLKMKDETNSTLFTETEEKRTNILNLFTIIIIAGTLLSLGKSLAFFSFNRKASLNLHKVMITKIVHAKMKFFDTHFIGNVLNRFSKDLSMVDEHLPYVINECFELSFILLGILILVGTVNPMFLIPAGIFFAIAFAIRHVYLKTGRNLQRLEASTRSPLIGHLNASLEGLTTIRAFKAQEIIRDEFDKHQDLYTSVNYTLHNSLRALAFLVDGLASLFITIVIVRFLVVPADTSVGNVGLAISQSFHLTNLLQYAIRRWADFENQMTSVERILQYTEVEQEQDNGKIVKTWPEKGEIVYENVSMSYTEEKKLVLKDITFSIKPFQKIGIVGRTGAGKSSIISTLFRLYDTEGVIKVDQVNINEISLDFLRSNITIIPQDPILISGSVRDNIDPLRKYQDEEIWKAIKITKLQDAIVNLSDQVDINSTFSAGQKQLICLARAIVRKNKIVVLDEATANLDSETDVLIRKVIEENFSGCTVITIAHRLSSVLSSNIVMVIDDGRIVEQDEPSKLLENKNSLFSKMIKQS